MNTDYDTDKNDVGTSLYFIATSCFGFSLLDKYHFNKCINAATPSWTRATAFLKY